MNRSTSIYLDLVRPIAALVVLLSHVSLQNISAGQFALLGGAGVQAVDVFFVLSGFVIAHVVATRETDPGGYAISRATRIYSVAVPAIILTAIVDAIGQHLSPVTYQGPFQPLTARIIVRSILFIGEQWNGHHFPGSNGPYWSLGFEVWYYVAFGVFFFTPRRWRWPAVAAVLLFIGPKVAILFPIWLMGVLVYRIANTQRIPPTTGWVLFLAPLAGLVGYQFMPHSPLQPFMPFSFTPSRLASTAQDYLIAVLFSVHLIGFSSISGFFSAGLERFEKAIRWVAGATFSIYLAHLPIMHLVAASSPWPKSSTATLILLLTVTPLACLVFAELSERRKRSWRIWITSVFNLSRRIVYKSRA